MATALTADEVLALPASVPIVTAGRALHMSRSATFDAFHRGDLPVRVIRVGRRLLVPRAELLRVLGLAEAASRQASA